MGLCAVPINGTLLSIRRSRGDSEPTVADRNIPKQLTHDGLSHNNEVIVFGGAGGFFSLIFVLHAFKAEVSFHVSYLITWHFHSIMKHGIV